MLVKLERDADAIASFDRALEIDSDYARAYYDKATCYALQGQARRAVESLERAIALNPRYREEARTDPDFDAIVENQRFWDLTEG
jgi:tetratricopeptide (TPR) repeat protein